MSLDGPLYPPEPQDRCVLHRATWCSDCWDLTEEDDS